MDAQTLQRGSVVDRYTVEGLLGEGGMARVFRVRHNQLGTTHALKILTISAPGIRQRLLAEGRAQATLRHPNIVAVTDALVLDGGQPALILELVEGPGLDVLLHQRTLTLEQADVLARGILEGVAEAHRHGLIHRDLKPANVLLQPLDGGYRPKVADFGLVKVLSGTPGEHGQTRTGSTMGTPQYMAPEQVRDAKHVGAQADVFALGCVLYELVAHERAFDGDDLLEIFNNVASSNHVPIREHVPELPDRMEQAIEAALRADPAERPASVEALAALWIDGQPLVNPTGAFPEVVRSLASVPSGAQPAQTWDEASPSSLDAPSSGSLDDRPGRPHSLSTGPGAAVALAGLGGGAILLGLVGLITVVGLAVGLIGIRSLSQDPAAQAPQPVPVEPIPASAPIPTSAPSVATTAPPAPAPGAPPSAPAPTGSAPTAPQPTAPGAGAPVAPAPPAPAPDSVTFTVPTPDVRVVEVVPTDPAPGDPDAPDAPGDGTEAPELSGFLASSDPDERRRGLDNLLRRGDPDADQTLGVFVRDGDDGSVRQHAWDLVLQRWDRRSGEFEVLQQIVGWQLAHGGERHAIEAAQAMGRNGDRPELLAPGLQHPNAAVALASVQAAGRMHRRTSDADWRALIEPLASSTDPGVSRQALRLLREL